ncbi:hypothetical protein K432DRAFT_438640 [Lepidopterella palustris CBS 459.81]|uniref:Uncharacterized protein n=1 Tax=Lepidopterella palustris CBS 459.81 TaxID=1314670 RepID=A0A8E2JKP1_9PEZI|nr:hypothetical protein K432DRAFT_438640 [Lepidopterella palustris CBS 459.81]
MKTVYPFVAFLSVVLVTANPVPITPGPVVSTGGIQELNVPSTNFPRSEDAAVEVASWFTKRAVAVREAVTNMLTAREETDDGKTKAGKGQKKGAAAAAAAAANSTAAATTKKGKGKGKDNAGATANSTNIAANATAAANTTAATNTTAAANTTTATGKNGKGKGKGAAGKTGDKDGITGPAKALNNLLGGNLRKREVRRSLNLWETEALRDAVGI